jgi:hypothetical protein
MNTNKFIFLILLIAKNFYKSSLLLLINLKFIIIKKKIVFIRNKPMKIR